MPSLGGKSIRALLRGANEGGEKLVAGDLSTKVGLVPEDAMMQRPANANMPEDSLDDVRHGMQDPAMKASYTEIAGKGLPWISGLKEHDKIVASAYLDKLLELGDKNQLDLFSRSMFGRRWAVVEDQVHEAYKFGDTGLDDFHG